MSVNAILFIVDDDRAVIESGPLFCQRKVMPSGSMASFLSDVREADRGCNQFARTNGQRGMTIAEGLPGAESASTTDSNLLGYFSRVGQSTNGFPLASFTFADQLFLMRFTQAGGIGT
jgi:hypothetical protein